MVKYDVKPIRIYNELKGTVDKQIFIVMTDERYPELIIPSTLTTFVLKQSREFNTQKKYADEICEFINYINCQLKADNNLFIKLKSCGLSGLNYYHLAHYINHISNDNITPRNYTTVMLKQDILFRFYKNLSIAKINTINDNILDKVENRNMNLKNSKMKRTTPFNLISDIVIYYPNTNYVKKPILKDMPVEIWRLFVEYAYIYAPRIAFGLVLTICSGIRRGECVNLRVKDIWFNTDNHTYYLNIKNNQSVLFNARDINLNNSQVKKCRKRQPVLPIHTEVEYLFDRHIKYLKDIYGTNDIKNRGLFVNADGNAMSGDSFSNYFYRLKNNFINYLYEEGLAEFAQQLRYYKWGTHIGRHIFTNTIIKNGYTNGTGNKPIAKLVAILRGDSCEESSNVYIDEITISTAVTKNINEISAIASEYNHGTN